ncbi:ester cyclase [Umboniibacter marinipuniceus]|uniref:SnoaL-like polyketide cyclase n=1 Tax=Umboniibacter marinipuniceus TaxID=569599 RepID=A0A3M0AB85_9GAMM|nr:ester cyclase [Umboniibacter marinipuniceus]RMA82433.1 SnoaL-like polyketide cyclase [Umboniibacter marinipuniceus]
MNRLENHFDSAPADSNETGNMTGFDSEFTDIVDYILRITYRIWEGKQVGLCYDYYSDDCPVYTIAGVSIGAEEVTQNTLNTMAAFPDRTLHAEDIIWGGDAQNGYHSSHRIRTHMTNLGPSDLGPASGKHAVIPVIAHCVCKDNKIVEEWLVRDNFSLAEQLGFDPIAVAKEKAALPLSDRLKDYIDSEVARLDAIEPTRIATPASSDEELAVTALNNIWNARMVGDVHKYYAENARFYGVNKRQLNGHQEIMQFYLQLLGSLSGIRFSADYVCSNEHKDGGSDVAVRWTLKGDHLGTVLYGKPTGAPIFILGESHFRIIDGEITEEWNIFDELSVWVQVFRAKNALAAGE